MKKKVLALVLVLAAMVTCGVRVTYLNDTAEKPSQKIVYQKGREAPIGTDVFFGKNEKMGGYFVTITDAKIVPLHDFLQTYHLEDDFLKDIEQGPGPKTDYIYEVHVHVRNKDNALYGTAGIDLLQWSLLATDYWTQIQSELYAKANPFIKSGSLKFSMKPGSSRDFILPYTISSASVKLSYLEKSNPSIIISAYPTRKLLAL